MRLAKVITIPKMRNKLKLFWLQKADFPSPYNALFETNWDSIVGSSYVNTSLD